MLNDLLLVYSEYTQMTYMNNMKCPKCDKEFEACPQCRSQHPHQVCLVDEMCRDCMMIDAREKGYDILGHSNPEGDTLCGKMNRMHRWKRINWSKTVCMYPGCNARC